MYQISKKRPSRDKSRRYGSEGRMMGGVLAQVAASDHGHEYPSEKPKDQGSTVLAFPARSDPQSVSALPLKKKEARWDGNNANE